MIRPLFWNGLQNEQQNILRSLSEISQREALQCTLSEALQALWVLQVIHIGVVGIGSTWFTLASLYSDIRIFNPNKKQVTLIICKPIAFQSKEKLTTLKNKEHGPVNNLGDAFWENAVLLKWMPKSTYCSIISSLLNYFPEPSTWTVGEGGEVTLKTTVLLQLHYWAGCCCHRVALLALF